MNYSAAAEAVKQAAIQASKWAAENPKSAVVYGVAGAGAGAALLAPAVIAGPALAAAGFSAKGIAAASLASGAQAGVGNVVAGSVFATLQSAGMAGYGAAIVNGVVQAGGAAVALAAGGSAAMQANKRKHPRNTDLRLIENMWTLLKADIKESKGDGTDAPENITDSTEVIDAEEQAWHPGPGDMTNDQTGSVPQ
ncbi:hypothetical protein F4781DRAFT_437090 [Annulohypoxylon bovei var. microspora]|nr:hypothetical protein F4781DRAFT_437090 [Annulohypoxylon bovei var. microspora]